MATIKLTQDFKEFLKLLNSEKIEYLLIGGYAVAIYGVVRPTKDLDVWVSIADCNLERLIQALAKFGFNARSLKIEMFKGPQTVFRMGVPPNRLEILTQISGPQFDACYARRRMVDIEGIQVSLIDLEDLKTNKRSTGRLQDQADVQKLEQRPKS